MPIRDLAAQVASLANDYGASHGANAPLTFEVALFIGDPSDEGVEVTATTTLIDEDSGDTSEVANGYSPVVIANDGAWFPPADPDTGVLTTALVTFPEAEAEYPDTVTHWLLRDPATGAGWDTGVLPRDDQIAVEGAGVTPRLTLAIFYAPVVPDGLA